jgi:RNA polymerase sigma-70 factor (sigma-E family)
VGVGRRGDNEFDEFFDALFPRARSLAWRIVGDRGAAEDVAAEAMTRAYARWSRLRSLPHRDAWVLRVATNVAIDAVRRRPAPVEMTMTTAPDDVAVLRAGLANALHALPQRQRTVVALRYLSDLTEAEVAEAMGLAVGTVKSHTHRALANLRSRLGDVEEVVHAVH